jgi:Xaa-Pro aminopeptidase
MSCFSIGWFFPNSSPTGTVAHVFSERMRRVRHSMNVQGIDAVLLSVGPDLPWLTGFAAIAQERLTMLVLTLDAEPTLVVPGFETERVVDNEQLLRVEPWGETENPLDLVTQALGQAATGRLAIGDHTWSRFLVALQQRFGDATWAPASELLAPLRASKDPEEVEALARAGAGVDGIADELQRGEIPLIGRTEAQVGADIRARILDRGHDKVNFCIVASGPNSSSPHHDTGDRIIHPGEPVLFDFGGTTSEPAGMTGYCSDTTRMVFTGQPPAEYQEAYDVLFAAQEAGFQAARVGTPAEEVDSAARSVLDDAGLGQYFLHRLGHGIGVEGHEDPYLVGGNTQPLQAGNAFSIEPGFYVEGKWGARIEDIVVATDDGPRRLNNSSRELAVVEC